MPGRVDADLLLVGSVPAGSTEEALRAAAAHFGDLVFALPDGETGPRADFAADYPIAAAGFTGLVERELARLLAVIPAGDLAIQWDIAFETLDIEGVVPWAPHEGGWERFAAAVDALPRLIPDDVLVGYHLCYGTNPEWPMYEARDMSVLVRMANYAFAASGRPMDWVHMAGPRLLRSEDERFFRPLADLAGGDTRVFLGIVLPVDGELGLRRREATARKFLPDFGVALYCGFRVAPGSTPEEAIQDHEDVVRAVRRLRLAEAAEIFRKAPGGR